MSEFNEPISTLREQQKRLILVIAEAEVKVAIFTKALDEGKAQLKKVEGVLRGVGKELNGSQTSAILDAQNPMRNAPIQDADNSSCRETGSGGTSSHRAKSSGPDFPASNV